MQHPCPTPQKPRSMAAVPPLHQVIQQSNLSPYDGNNLSYSASRTSSFAAALRKLAKQAGDPVIGDKEVSHISPVSSPSLSQGSLTPKRNVPTQQSVFLSTHQAAYSSTSPPIVTIAPSKPHNSLSSDSRKASVIDLSSLPQGGGNSSGLSNGHLVEPLSLKLDSSKTVPRPTATNKWDDISLSNKVLPPTSGSSQVRPHATIAPLPRPDDSLTSSRGFQPYRGADDVRTSLPHHLTSFDHHAAYPYSPAFLPHPHLPHPAYRFDEPLYLERYNLLRPPLMSFPPQSGIMAPHGAFYPSGHYDLLAQSLSLTSPSNNILSHDRLKREDEQRHKERECDIELAKSREHERECPRERDKDLKDKEHKDKDKDQRTDKERRERVPREKEDRAEHSESKKANNSPQIASSKKPEILNMRNSPSNHFNINQSSPPSSSAPLNLVVHPNNEQSKRESELWLPWQQQPSQSVNKDQNEEGLSIRNPVGIHQENHRQNLPKENSTSSKSNSFQSVLINDKKSSSVVDGLPNNVETSKHSSDSKKFDLLHHHLTELSNKTNNESEWKPEKIQKVTSNNSHKKIFTTELKKIKDESHQSHSYYNHSRKPVNGMIVKPNMCQDEGMHARLLETEKYRMEFNNQTSGRIRNLNESIEKTSIPMLKPLSVQINGIDVNSPAKLFSDNRLHKSESVFIKSKLDNDYEELQKNLLKEESADSEDEEIALRNFLIISKGPPLPMESNPKKTHFFHLLGLSTHYKRKKMELEMYLKRQKLFHENGDLSLLNEEKVPEEPSELNENLSDMKALSEKLHSSSSPEKLQFLLTLDLNSVTLAKKEEHERLRKVAEDEKIRRNQRMSTKIAIRKKKYRLLVPKKDKASSQLKKESLWKKRNGYISFKSISTQVDETLLSDKAFQGNFNTPRNFVWPGLEMVMEAYIRHQTEQSLEKEVLTERYHHLRFCQEELKSEADSLTKSLSELMKLKRELEDKRHLHQQSIEHLKEIMHVTR